MNFYPARVLPLVSVAFLVSCGSSVKTDLEQMKNRGATRKEVQEKIDTIHQASSGSVMTGVEAEKWIKNFCGGKIEEDGVRYVWMGGMDHTNLYVRKNNSNEFEIFANYDDATSESKLWPK